MTFKNSNKAPYPADPDMYSEAWLAMSMGYAQQVVNNTERYSSLLKNIEDIISGKLEWFNSSITPTFILTKVMGDLGYTYKINLNPINNKIKVCFNHKEFPTCIAELDEYNCRKGFSISTADALIKAAEECGRLQEMDEYLYYSR